ncbi:hypothetical protein Hanom_Chr06g00562031 [Helianthus anomalus]
MALHFQDERDRSLSLFTDLLNSLMVGSVTSFMFLKTYENKLLNGSHESQVFVSFLSKHASKAEIAEVWSHHNQRITASPATSGGPSSFSAISGRVQSCYLELGCLPSAINATRLRVTGVLTHPPSTTLLHSSPTCVPCHSHTQHIRPPPVDTFIRRATPANTFS